MLEIRHFICSFVVRSLQYRFRLIQVAFSLRSHAGPLFGSSDREQKSGLTNLHGRGAWSRPVEESRPPPAIQDSQQPDHRFKITNHGSRRSGIVSGRSAKLGSTAHSWSSTESNFRSRDCGEGERNQANSTAVRNHKPHSRQNQ